MLLEPPSVQAVQAVAEVHLSHPVGQATHFLVVASTYEDVEGQAVHPVESQVLQEVSQATQRALPFK
jgi:hypothetical protein